MNAILSRNTRIVVNLWGVRKNRERMRKIRNRLGRSGRLNPYSTLAMIYR